MPPILLIRQQFKVTADQPSFQVASYYLVMSLLDPEQNRADDLADLYRQPWNLELFFRDIKTTVDRGFYARKHRI